MFTLNPAKQASESKISSSELSDVLLPNESIFCIFYSNLIENVFVLHKLLDFFVLYNVPVVEL